MKFLILNGPNLNLLGLREPEIYGRDTYDDLVALTEKTCREASISPVFYQSNHEGDLIDAVQEARLTCDGIILNPGGYSHTSIALADALRAVGLPAVEVHITDPVQREPFRRVSYTGMACLHTIKGRGIDGYRQAVLWLKDFLSGK